MNVSAENTRCQFVWTDENGFQNGAHSDRWEENKIKDIQVVHSLNGFSFCTQTFKCLYFLIEISNLSPLFQF